MAIQFACRPRHGDSPSHPLLDEQEIKAGEQVLSFKYPHFEWTPPCRNI
jgi:hypothetical protein